MVCFLDVGLGAVPLALHHLLCALLCFNLLMLEYSKVPIYTKNCGYDKIRFKWP
jgi:hypothetical protein